MSDDFFYYYEKELSFLRKSGEEFSKQFPKIAGRLRMSGENVEDPHISRLIESVAFLNSKVQKRLDNDFPEITEGLLSIIYPHYVRPIPSYCIAHFVPQRDLDSPYHLPQNTSVETEPSGGMPCRFKTVYPTELWPFYVEQAKILPRPFITPGASKAFGAQSVLHLQLKLNAAAEDFSQIDMNKVRFFLNGQAQITYPLYQLLLQHCSLIVAASGTHDSNPSFISIRSLKPVGFSPEEGLIPYPAQSFIGYRLLTEFFSAPDKFLFFELDQLNQHLSTQFTRELNLYFYFDSSNNLLEKNTNKDHFVLGATPIINLFEQNAEPITLDHSEFQYEVIPDARYEDRMSVYSIDEVSSISPEGNTESYLPIYNLNSEHDNDSNTLFWHSSHRYLQEQHKTFISLIDLNFNEETPDYYILNIQTTCTNHNEPIKLPFGSGQPHFSCSNSAPPLQNILSLTAPSPSLHPSLGKGSRWKLISHLNLNHLSLASSAESLNALKELLRLYDFKDSPTTRAQIDSIVSLETEPMTAPIKINSQAALCRGTQITITFDERLLAGNSAYLMASVLERFFGLYCSVNSFTRLVAKIKGKEGVLKKWPPRAGVKELV